ncbi:Polysaccharide biosynthesis/export protein (plasmid) [Labrenzia sp. THAF191b]|uniref:polysaccharide biosynthesis/export family protein n=1 Tax=Labrenzia sp. THAF191b TaxID=2587867 RepID=UPI0012A9BC35|nr:polysaccharide biosynthesis/export family protein [Labrenzia sp. THAF191b]MCR9284726.1 polysaccharide biosynthesis/export family protein [Paracoccaceae bacterium]QFT01762.1 Polysaccharide biosynthesis/export protein [Labrenzia sp. THAF191b]QFT07967.1 Polysaccharide biosynthesis/export protein [Labrenzia sp. THAF191a]QFT19668.1 Polysaccharide biosynthesis/export protein [Labrenzia sp. THAF187b]
MSIRFIIAVLSLSTFLVSGLSAEQYRLSGGETLELRAGAWDARNKTFANWDGVAGSYKMAPDGNIHVPIAGAVEVVGKTLDEVADTIASRMQRIVGLTELPAVSVEVSRYAPVFVGGAVTAPGQFDFIPGMTVEKALAIAGGYYRLPNEEGTQQTSLTRITGEINQLRGTASKLLQQEKRLEQEVQLYSAETLPDAVESQSSDPVQSKILSANIKVIKAELQSLKDLRVLLNEKISQLSEEIVLRDNQIELARKDLASMEHLKDKGLAVTTRVSSANTALNDLEAKRLQLEVARLDAQQRLNLASRDAATLFDRTRGEKLSELTEVKSKRFEVESRLELARKVYAETLSANSVDTTAQDSIVTPSYRISRLENGEMQSLDVDLNAFMRPGDSLTINLTISEPASK